MKTHLGETITGARLTLARNYAASVNLRYAISIERGQVEFADHMTREAQLTIAKKERRLAKEIQAGKHDHNFTIWQRMNYNITGESVAFLPA